MKVLVTTVEMAVQSALELAQAIQQTVRQCDCPPEQQIEIFGHRPQCPAKEETS